MIWFVRFLANEYLVEEGELSDSLQRWLNQMSRSLKPCPRSADDKGMGMTFTANLDDYMTPVGGHGPLTEADSLCLGSHTLPVSDAEKLAAGLAMGPSMSATTAYRLLDSLGYRLPADTFYELDAADLHSRVLLAQVAPPLADNGVGAVVIGQLVDTVASGTFAYIYQELATVCEYAMLWDVSVILA